MSDFLYSRGACRSKELTSVLAELTRAERSEIRCFEGEWGSLAVSRNRHHGYQPLEDAAGISLVIGGPLTRLKPVDEPAVSADNCGTAIVAHRVFRRREGTWHDDLLTPFCFVYIDKRTYAITVVTDIMSFIPVYCCTESVQVLGDNLTLSTHVDAAAFAFGQQVNHTLYVDPVAICDLILNNRITYPYTIYTNVREISPATRHCFVPNGRHTQNTYWRPIERFDRYDRIAAAAAEIRGGLEEAMLAAMERYRELGLLLSAGEDSRMLACMVSRDVPLRCFTAAPTMNREARIARRVAKCLGATWQFIPLTPEKYFEDVGRRTLYTGSSSHGRLAHFIGVFEDTPVAQQQIVLGGFKADTFLKGHYLSAKRRVPGISFQYLSRRNRNRICSGKYVVSREMEQCINDRIRRHRDTIAELRPKTADDWLKFWPMSQDHDIAHYWSNRRLFASEEVFMSPKIVDVAACLPDHWVINRRLFHAIAKPYLRRVWWIPHGDGHFPAFPWYANSVLRPIVRLGYRLTAQNKREAQGSWPSLDDQLASSRTHRALESLLPLADTFLRGELPDANRTLTDRSIPVEQRYAYVQVLSTLSAIMSYGFSLRASSPEEATTSY